MKTILLSLTLVGLVGCASLDSRQLETEPGGTSRTTHLHSFTFFDSKSDLAKYRASTTDKSQTTSIGGLGQEASATNVVNIFQMLFEAGFQAGKRTIIPVP